LKIIIAQVINGIALGSIYALLVTGFNLMFLVGKIIHFAYPYIVVMSIYTCWGLLQLTDNSLLAIFGTILTSIVLHMIAEPLFRHINTRKGTIDINSSFILSLGIALILTEIMSHKLNYGFPISFPINWMSDSVVLEFNLIRVSGGQLYTLSISILITLILFVTIYRTQLGRAFRAIAENISMARLQGIPILRLNLLLYGIAGLIGGIIALLFSMLIGSASPWLGDYIALKVLAIAIVAGLGNMKGGLICGLALGILESLIINFFPGSWSNAIAFLIMLLVILIKPKGVFNKNSIES
jgi:branched-chain amino acid transport system permease protein